LKECDKLDSKGKERMPRRLKGVPSSCVKHYVTHEKYKQYITNASTEPMDVSFKKIGTKSDYKLVTISQSKRALAGFDSKRYILPDGINTRPLGHYLNDEQ